MKRMFSPWRSTYIASFRTPKKGRDRKESIFTQALRADDDDTQLIVWRSRFCFVILNRYPYNSGHLMVVPNRQTPDFLDLRAEELADIMATIQRAVRALRDAIAPEGFNLGVNLGRAGGAGVDSHVHFHIVPRWNGDTNFMPVVGEVKVISEDMKATLRKLRSAFVEQDGSARSPRRGRAGRTRKTRRKSR